MGIPSRGAACSDSAPTTLINLSTVKPSGAVYGSSMETASPGWYYDPADEALYRFWNGTSWTEHSSDLFSSSPPSDN